MAETKPDVRLVPLAVLAAELGEPVDQLERELGSDVQRDAAGIRSITHFKASLLIETRARREAEAREAGRARAEEGRKLRAQQREAAIRARERRNANPIHAPEGVPLAQAAAAAHREAYLNGGDRPRLSQVDYIFGGGPAGGTIGPSADELSAAKEARAANRRARRGGK